MLIDKELQIMQSYSNRALIIIVALALILLLSIWVWVDPWLEKRIDALCSYCTWKEIIDIKNNILTTYAQIIGGIFLLVGVYFTVLRIRGLERQIQISQEGQVTERFTRAVEQLSSENPTISLGGVYALERIARDSKKDYWPIMEILTTYVRNNAPCKEAEWDKLSDMEKASIASEIPVKYYAVSFHSEIDSGPRFPGEEEKPKPVSIVTQAILTVLGRRMLDYEKGSDRWLNLEKTNLPRVDLRGAKLNRINLTGAYIDWADLSEVQLEDARLEFVHMIRSNLKKANLKSALLRFAHLEEADMEDADLKKANLEEAYLIGTNFKAAKLNEAILSGAQFGKSRSKDEQNALPFPLGDAPIRLPYTAQTSFEGADFRSAILCETDLRECNLTGADLRGVDLTYRTKITKEQIEKAIIDETTKLPENLKVDAKKKS